MTTFSIIFVEASIMQRRWFHIHFSTAIVLMLLAGGLLWLNCRTHLIRAGPGSTACGWPLTAYHTESMYQPGLVGHFNRKNLVCNTLVALAMLFPAAGICECLIRGWKPQATSESPKRRKFQIHLSTLVVLTITAGMTLSPIARVIWEVRQEIESGRSGGEYYSDVWFVVALMTALSLASLFVVGVLSEWLIRRRERLNPKSEIDNPK